MRVALYVRRSTNERLQAESLNVQEARLRAFAAQNGHDVIDVFADSASGLTANGRRDFGRLLQAVQQGASFNAVLVRDVSRWGRFQNVDESAYFEFFLLLHNVRVIYAEESFDTAPHPYDGLLKAMRRISAADFSREKSRLVQAAHAHAIQKGWRVDGPAPYGMDFIVVTHDGKFVRRLKKGEHKENSTLRLKLAPSRGRSANVIRRIFDAYVNRGMSFAEIARALNRDGLRTPRNKAWTGSLVAQILENAAYAGIARAKFRRSANFPEPTVIEKTDAWTGVIPLALFRAAETRIHSRRRYPPIDDDFREAVEEWTGEPAPSDITWEQIRTTFINGEISTGVTADVAPRAVDAVAEVIGAFEHADATDRGFLLNGVFELGVRYSFPILFDGRLVWDFRTSAAEPEDATVFVGISPPPDPKPVRIFLLFSRRLKRLGATYHPRVLQTRFRNLIATRPSHVADRLERCLYTGKYAKRQLLEAIRGLSWVNTAHVARQLGWPEHATYDVYRRLKASGASVPPLLWHAAQHVTWKCARCAASREMTLRAACAIKSELCKRCRDAEHYTRRVSRYTCSECGADRIVTNAALTKRYARRKPEDAICQSCAGVRNIEIARRELIRRSVMVRRAYGRLATQIAYLLKKHRSPSIALIRGAPRFISYGKRDGSRIYARLFISAFETASRLVAAHKRSVYEVARRIVSDAALWRSSTRTRPTVIPVDVYAGSEQRYAREP